MKVRASASRSAQVGVLGPGPGDHLGVGVEALDRRAPGGDLGGEMRGAAPEVDDLLARLRVEQVESASPYVVTKENRSSYPAASQAMRSSLARCCPRYGTPCLDIWTTFS